MEELKVVLIGPAGVGKTQLVKQFTEGRFDNSYTATIGANFVIKEY